MNQASIPDVRKQKVDAAVARKASPAALAVIAALNSELGPSAARDANLAKLAAGSTVAVLTGQQTGLFLTPQLILAKALGAVVTARALEDETGVAAVPIFWLQTEDHDYDEIRRAWLPTATGELRELALPAEPGRKPVAHYVLPAEIESLHQILLEELGRFAPAAEVLALVRRCYSAGESISRAFARLLAACTEQYGLLFFDPLYCSPAAPDRVLIENDSARARVFELAFSKREEIEAALVRRTEELHKSGAQQQVKIRENSPLFFVHRPAAPGSPATSGDRFRVEWKPAMAAWQYMGGDDEWASSSELQALIKDSPQRLSSSALLRPLLQDCLFPTAAYLGGPAELRYMAQIAPLYPLFSLTQPLILARPQLTLVEPKLNLWLRELGLSPETLLPTAAETLQLVLSQRSHPWMAPLEVEKHLADLLEQLHAKLAPSVAALDSTLMRPLEKSEGKVKKDFAGFLKMYRRSCEMRDEVVLTRVRRALTVLRPQEQEQDRVISPLYFLCRYGFTLPELMLKEIVPFSNEQKFIYLDN